MFLVQLVAKMDMPFHIKTKTQGTGENSLAYIVRRLCYWSVMELTPISLLAERSGHQRAFGPPRLASCSILGRSQGSFDGVQRSIQCHPWMEASGVWLSSTFVLFSCLDERATARTSSSPSSTMSEFWAIPAIRFSQASASVVYQAVPGSNSAHA